MSFSPTFTVRQSSPRGKAPRPPIFSATSSTQNFGLLLSACAFCFAFGCCIGFIHTSYTARANGFGTQTLVHSTAKKTLSYSKGGATSCDNSCFKANDGVCDDGRRAFSGKPTDVFCDLGTDCNDCGPWNGDQPKTWDQAVGPVRFVKDKKFTLRLTATTTRPSFLMPYSDPEKDLDVSHLMEKVGMIEGGITHIFREVLKDRCVRADGSRGLVVDVGANFGYFTLYAASMGCRVIAWEPVPQFRAFVQYALSVNNLTSLVTLRPYIASATSGQELTMEVPTVGIWGTASVGGINQAADQAPETVRVKTERIDEAVKEDVLLMKVDVEGFEPYVFQSADNLIKNYNVENIVLEYNAGVAEKLATVKSSLHGSLIYENPRMLLRFLKYGYKLAQMHDNVAKSGGVDWRTQLPAMPEVTAENLKYDLGDMDLFDKGQLGCPLPEELVSIEHRYWQRCNMVPEDSHPKSLRVVFPYNTNIWATKNFTLLTLDKPVGLFSLDQDMGVWHSLKDPAWGTGLRSCLHVPVTHLIRNRCTCDWARNKLRMPVATAEEIAACEAEQAILLKHLKAGNMPSSRKTAIATASTSTA